MAPCKQGPRPSQASGANALAVRNIPSNFANLKMVNNERFKFKSRGPKILTGKGRREWLPDR